jgi:predicted DNA-binding protein
MTEQTEDDQRLSRHVPVRFRADTIDRAKRLAERDGMTVSAWIRQLIEHELTTPVVLDARLTDLEARVAALEGTQRIDP